MKVLKSASVATDIPQFQQIPALPAVFSLDGISYVKTGLLRFPVVGGTYTIEAVTATVATAPTGASLIVDVRKNGTTIYSGGTGRPAIAVSTNSANGGTPSTTSVTSGDYLTVDVAQVGSTVAGADLVVIVHLRRTA